MTRRRSFIAAVLAGMVVILPACGGDEGADAGGDDAGVRTTHAGGKTSAGGPTTAVTVIADDLYLKPPEVRVPAGTLDVTYVNEGQLEHTLLVDGVRGLDLLVRRKGDTARGAIGLDPGEYRFYCDVPGHRAVCLESRLIVE